MQWRDSPEVTDTDPSNFGTSAIGFTPSLLSYCHVISFLCSRSSNSWGWWWKNMVSRRGKKKHPKRHCMVLTCTSPPTKGVLPREEQQDFKEILVSASCLFVMQYLLGHVPPSSDHSGSWHDIFAVCLPISTTDLIICILNMPCDHKQAFLLGK